LKQTIQLYSHKELKNLLYVFANTFGLCPDTNKVKMTTRLTGNSENYVSIKMFQNLFFQRRFSFPQSTSNIAFAYKRENSVRDNISILVHVSSFAQVEAKANVFYCFVKSLGQDH